MEARLITLKSFLDELGLSSDIQTLDDRKRIQKGVYLGQLSGADLGYRFSWYLMGPYSPSLTKDYFQLADALRTRPAEFEGRRLKPEYRAQLNRVRPLLQRPEHLPISQEQWLELVASVHYLRRVSGVDRDELAERLATKKPGLAEYLNEAEKVLAGYQLL